MSSTTAHNGRLCNQIIRNLAISFVAEKHDLRVEYSSFTVISRLGVRLHCGTRSHDSTRLLTDNNYFDVLHSEECNQNVNGDAEWFQTKEITNKIYKHLSDCRQPIIEKNQFRDRYSANNDCFVHVRLGDVAQYNVGVEYYKKVVSNVQFDTLYISSDSPNHPIVCQLLDTYGGSKIIKYDEIKTLQFGSTCKHIVLSHGSFSAVIGYLSFFSDVYYPDYSLAPRNWHGDMFSIPGWSCVRL